MKKTCKVQLHARAYKNRKPLLTNVSCCDINSESRQTFMAGVKKLAEHSSHCNSKPFLRSLGGDDNGNHYIRSFYGAVFVIERGIETPSFI